MHCGVDPWWNYDQHFCVFLKKLKTTLTASFTEIEAQEDEDDTSDDQEQADEVELIHVFLQWPSMVRVEVKEEEQQEEPNTACWPATSKALACQGQLTPEKRADRLMKKHLGGERR